MLSYKLGRLIDISGAAIFLVLLLLFAFMGETVAAIGATLAISAFLVSIWIGELQNRGFEVTWEYWVLVILSTASVLSFLAFILGVQA